MQRTEKMYTSSRTDGNAPALRYSAKKRFRDFFPHQRATEVLLLVISLSYSGGYWAQAVYPALRSLQGWFAPNLPVALAVMSVFTGLLIFREWRRQAEVEDIYTASELRKLGGAPGDIEPSFPSQKIQSPGGSRWIYEIEPLAEKPGRSSNPFPRK